MKLLIDWFYLLLIENLNNKQIFELYKLENVTYTDWLLNSSYNIIFNNIYKYHIHNFHNF